MPYTRAQTFSALIDLVGAAETALVAAGYTDVEDRVHILRGIYYGTMWSMDYRVEVSPVRNLGFQTYTASTEPPDPRPYLPAGLFDALLQSAEVGGSSAFPRKVDFGHLVIGMDARRSYVARTVPIPTQGGTGLEISTWLGDLGGGAAMTALARVRDPSYRARNHFRGSDYGGPVNLEGDAAGYLAGCPAGAVTGVPGLALSGTVADALDAYLEPGGPSASGPWNRRCKDFLLALGGRFAGTTLVNRAALEASLAGQIQAFGGWYLVNRLRQTGRLTSATLRAASVHLIGASTETASIFLDALIYCSCTSCGAAIQARTDPAASPAGAPAGGLVDATADGLDAAERGQRRLGEFKTLFAA